MEALTLWMKAGEAHVAEHGQKMEGSWGRSVVRWGRGQGNARGKCRICVWAGHTEVIVELNPALLHPKQ